MFPSIPQYQLQLRTCRWYEQRMVALVEDMLTATNHFAVSRSLLSNQRRSEIPAHKQIKMGRKVFYILPFGDLPPKARRFRKNDSNIIENKGEDVSDIYSYQ